MGAPTSANRSELGPSGDAGPPGQRRRGREGDTHLVPGFGQRMAEGVDRSLRIGSERLGGREQNAGCAQRDERVTWLDRRQAHRTRGVVPCATCENGRSCHSPARGQFRSKCPGGGIALDQARHRLTGQAGGSKQDVGPVSGADVEPERAGGIRHFLNHFPGHAVANIGFRQQHGAQPGKHGRLVFSHPRQFGRGEPGHGDIAGHLP